MKKTIKNWGMVVLAVLILLPVYNIRANSVIDIDAPKIESFEMSPAKIDTTDSEQKVLIKMHVTDNASGVSNVFLNFTSPSNGSNRGAGFSFNQYDGSYLMNGYSYPYEPKNALISGTGLDGIFQIEVVFPRYSEAGIWKLDNISVADKNNNYKNYSKWNNFDGLDITNIATEILNEATIFDASAPTIESLEISPVKVSTNDGEQKISITIHMKDDITGINNAYLNFVSPSGNNHKSAGFSFNQYDGTYVMNSYSYSYPYEPKNALISGTGVDGVFRIELTLPQYSETGIWKLDGISATDNINNYKSYSSWNNFDGLNIPTDILNEATASDSSAPIIESLEFLPATVDEVTGNQKIIIRMHLTDDNTGVSSSYLSLESPSGNSNLMAGFYFNEFTGKYPINSTSYPNELTNALISGSSTDGIFEAELIFPLSSEIGDWKLSSMNISDKINNNRYYSQWDNFSGLDIPTIIRNGIQNDDADLYSPITEIESIQGTKGENDWYISDVSLKFNAYDTPSSSVTNIEKTEYKIDNQEWSAYDGEELVINNEGQHILYYRSIDDSNNVEETKEFQFKIDKGAPQISVVSPEDNKTYLLNEDVASDWNAEDETSGILNQTGTLEKGEMIDTSSVGEKTFTVTAKDQAGNSSSKTITYKVVYSFGGFQSFLKNGKIMNANSAAAVNFQLTDFDGKYIPNAAASLEINGKPAVASGKSNDGNIFRYDSLANQYIFNLSLKNTSLGGGIHTLSVKLDDGTVYNQDIVVK